MRRLLIAFSAGTFAICSGSAWACEASDLYGLDDFPVPVVSAEVSRLHFLAPASSKTPGCPSASKQCELPTYLVAGDEVLMTDFAEGEDGLVCAHYISPAGKVTSGWLDNSALTYRGDSMVRFDSADAYGDWVNGLQDATITIAPAEAADSDYVLVSGDATRGPPSYNTGSFAGPAYMTDNNWRAGYDSDQYRGDAPASSPRSPSDGCRIRFRFAGHYLLVDDNMICGGNGVTFSGVYAKKNGS